MSDKTKVNVAINDKADAHLGYAEVALSEICPVCRRLDCNCGGDE